MRILLGALLGLVFGSLAVAALGNAMGSYAYLATLLAGVLAGVAMRGLASGSKSPYAKGALAAVATIAAAVLGPIAEAQWLRARNVAVRTEVPEAAADAADATTDEGGDEVPVALQEPRVQVLAGETGAKAPYRAPSNDPFATAQVACLVIGCLVAYQIGRGAEPAKDEEGTEADAPHNEPSPLPPVD